MHSVSSPMFMSRHRISTSFRFIRKGLLSLLAPLSDIFPQSTPAQRGLSKRSVV